VLARGGLIDSGYVRPPLVEPTPTGVAAIDRLIVEGGALLHEPLDRLASVLTGSGR